MKKVYLCSRVAQDARPMNNLVADALIAAGYDVFVPHTQKHNNHSGASDAEIYQQDMDAMKSADICVAVGRLGVDCGYEIGWFEGRDVPVYRYLPEPDKDRHPMFHKMNATSTYKDLQQLVNELQKAHTKFAIAGGQ